mmetsp:Transcript_6618/g.13115  ORF Transcript_6618/g.13115 Transcript_6618/m.13115 type:complete len:357 (-) Transcript_6618:154-1224(-)
MASSRAEAPIRKAAVGLVALGTGLAAAYRLFAVSDRRKRNPPSRLTVERIALHVPELKELAEVIANSLRPVYRNVSTRVITCPRLTDESWSLPSPGISGSNAILDVGGEHHQVEAYANELSFGLEEVAVAAELRGWYFLGAGAAPRGCLGCNGELIPFDNLHSGTRNSQLATVERDEKGDERPGLCKYNSSTMGFLANVMSCEGKQGDVIEVKASVRTSSSACESFTECIRRGIASGYAHDEKCGPIGLGGVFKVVKGRVKVHVMADTAGRVFTDSSQVQEYLKMFTIGPDLTCATIMISKQPSGTTKKVRLEHTHLFNSACTEGGHYHGDVTPQEVEYVAYLVPTEELLLIDKRS